MKTFSRLVALGAAASGVGGVLLAVSAPSANAMGISPGNTVITSPSIVTISATLDPATTGQLFFDGTQVDSQRNLLGSRTLSYSFNATQYPNGTYTVKEVEKTANLLVSTVSSTIKVAIPRSSSGSAGSGGSGGSSGSGGSGGSGVSGAHSGAVSGGSGGNGSGGGSGSAGGGVASAPAVLGYSGPTYGGTGFGSAYSRLDALSGGSSLVLPDVAPQNGFQLPVKPARQAKLASSPSRATSLTAATWLIGVALGLITLLTAAHTGAWARRRRRLRAVAATADGGGAAAASATATTSAPAARRARHRR